MKSEEWKSYRTRFLVNAKQLNSSLSFVDHLGRQHCGRKGDYLVESSDGVLSIAPRRIFEDIYVPMPQFDEPGSAETMIAIQRSLNARSMNQTSADPKIDEPEIGEQKIDRLQFEAFEIEEVKLGKPPIGRRRVDETRLLRHDLVRNDQPAPARKLPQPCRDRRASALRLM